MKKIKILRELDQFERELNELWEYVHGLEEFLKVTRDWETPRVLYKEKEKECS